MRKISFLILAFYFFAAFSVQTASAQFPKLPKISKPKPTPTETEQPAPSGETQPTQPQPEGRNTKKPSSAEGGVYAKREMPTDTPRFLPETLNISCDTQDYYWKLPKESNYTSWIPHIQFYAIYAGSIRLRYKAEYFMPDGQSWYSESLLAPSGLTDSRTSAVLIESEYVSEKHQGKAITSGGMFGVKITNTRNNEVVFQGKFKVVKFKPENTDARYRNLVDFYVDQDWNLPIGYADIRWNAELDTPHPDEAYPLILMWFKGGINTSDLEARLFHNGQQIATTDDGGSVGNAGERAPKHAGNDPALQWYQYEFTWPRKILFIGDAHARAMTSNRNKLFINESPGEYTVKVFYKGEQVREIKFSIADGNFADNGIAKQNKLTTNKIILPVKVLGNADKWNASTWKTDAFYGNPLTGFSAP